MGAREKIAHEIAKQLGHINVNVTVEPIVDKTFWQKIFKDDHEFSFFLAGWSVGHSIDRTLKQLFCRKTETMGRINFTKYYNPEVEGLIEQAIVDSGTGKRLMHLRGSTAGYPG